MISPEFKPEARLRIWFVNRFFWPDEPATAQLLTDLAQALARRGHELHILCARTGPDQARLQERDGITIHRVGGCKTRKNSLWGKGLAWFCFLLRAPLRLFLSLRKGDSLVLMTDPPFLPLLCMPLAFLRGARCFNWIQDIHPEAALRLAIPPVLRHLLEASIPVRNFLWEQADCNVVPSPSMGTLVAKACHNKAKVLVVHNWAPSGLYEPTPEDVLKARQAAGVDGCFLLMYSGNLGRVHDIDAIASIIIRLARDPRFAFMIVGEGAGRERLRKRLETAGLEQAVRFTPPVPREQLSLSLAMADLHLVTLLEGRENLVFPSKLYGVMAVGRPVLAIAPDGSDLSNFVKTANIGIAGPATDIEALALSVRRLASDKDRLSEIPAACRTFLAATGDASRAAAFWESLLSSPLPPPPAAGLKRRPLE